MTRHAATLRVVVVEPLQSVGTPPSAVLRSDRNIEVIGAVSSPADALEFVRSRRPDLVVIDSSLPRQSGFELTRQIMQTNPLPVVMVGACGNPDEMATTFAALEAGAVAMVARPNCGAGCIRNEEGRKLLQTVRAMAEIKVVRRWSRDRFAQLDSPGRQTQRTPRLAPDVRIVAIGASTGGPLVLQTILSRLPASFSAPILVVQHISPGFVGGLANWLRSSTKLSVVIPQDAELALPGRVYLAPDALHMEIGGDGRINLTPLSPGNGNGPSVARLFASVAARYGRNAVGILLTGMGKDGAAELGMMKQKGALALVQDRESSVVFGMPGEAVALGAACFELTPENIAAALHRAVEDRIREPIV